MKKRWILLVSIVLFQTILTGCASKTAQLPEECLAQNMLISKEDIGAAYENALMSPLSDEPVNSAATSFYYPAPAFTDVIQHKDKNIQSVYQSRAEFVFRSDEGSHSWVKPADVLFESTLADEYDYRCGFLWDEYCCKYIARFKGYLIYLSLDIGPDGYSLEGFSAGMAAIDREVGECFAALEEATPEP
ncbi:MAG TPA: hypothetical protein PLT26_07160 [Anaerolineaceae bacterium]|nr:hypothetical protein [Anaerolineaceae bacterium]HQH85443.1 hypothetical protein [Anaerolineaceae bacterium]